MQKRGAQKRLFYSNHTLFGRLVLVVLILCLYINLYRIVPFFHTSFDAQSALAIAAGEPAAKNPSARQDQSAIPGEVLQQLAHSSSTTIPKSAPCSVNASYQSPSPLQLTSNSPVLAKVIEAPYTYEVTGSSVTELSSNLSHCSERIAVAGAYHAITARQINWVYGFTDFGDGTCALDSPRIGLHIAQLLPSHTPTAATVEVWNAYYAHLVTHENGHVELAVAHMERLAAQLQIFGRLNCDLLKKDVAQTIDTAITVLNTEDTLYDTATGHGIAQGALL